MNRQMHTPALLLLENGLFFKGYAFGSLQPSSGEVVFNTAMAGHPEGLTDPSCFGQILCATYPMIGNYGVPKDQKEGDISLFFESNRIHINGLIVTDYSKEYSHWNAQKSLDDWLKEHKVPGLYGIDTRALTQILRQHGALLGQIIPGTHTCSPDSATAFQDPNQENLAAKVSCTEIIEYQRGAEKSVVLVDCGVTHSLLRALIGKGIHIIRVPWDYDFNQISYHGVVLSEGPGNPQHLTQPVTHLQRALQSQKPILGIGMGHLLLAKAIGAQICKLKYGHHGHNHPVRLVGSSQCFITTQNHSYAVDSYSLSTDWKPLYTHLNDGTNEGFCHQQKPIFSAQFLSESLIEQFLTYL